MVVVYVFASEAHLERKLFHSPFDDYQYEIETDPSIPYKVMNDLNIVYPELSETCNDVEFRNFNKTLAIIFYWMSRYREDILRELASQKRNPFLRLYFSLQRLGGELGLNEDARRIYERDYEPEWTGYEEFREMLYKTITDGDCLEPTQALTLSPTTKVTKTGILVVENINPYKLPSNIVHAFQTPVYFDVHGIPPWLEVQPQQGVLLTGESEPIEFSASCPPSAVSIFYEADLVIFKVPSFPESVEVRLECPTTPSS